MGGAADYQLADRGLIAAGQSSKRRAAPLESTQMKRGHKRGAAKAGPRERRGFRGPEKQVVGMHNVRTKRPHLPAQRQRQSHREGKLETQQARQVNVGNATDQVDSETNVVVALEGNAMLTDLRIEPSVFTPNGDGVNDVLTFHFSVNRLHTEKVVQVSIYDLSGRLVQQLREQRTDPRGRYAFVWPGDGLSVKKVPPGIYLARLELEAESARAEQTAASRLVRVAY